MRKKEEEMVIFYTNANDLSSIQHMEDSQYLIEDLQDHEEQAQLISDIASHGQQFTANGEYFRHKHPMDSPSEFSTKPTRGNHEYSSDLSQQTQ